MANSSLQNGNEMIALSYLTINQMWSDFKFRRQMRRDDLQHLREDFGVGGDDIAGVEKAFVADKIADQATGFLHQ